MIDLRSDTVTKPTKKMREVIANAEVGDDVLGDDIIVNNLQERVAKMFGKEAGLFMPSGTMSNQIAIAIQTEPGTEVICDKNSHIYIYESAAPSIISGVQIKPLDCGDEILIPEILEKNIHDWSDIHHAPTTLIEVENTNNKAGGIILSLERIKKIKEIADKYKIPLHLDGARIWNASVATGISFEKYGKYFDTISVCFSKGLGAPVGSMLLGTKKLIEKALRKRKQLGGGMRQIGLLAAAVDYALDNNLDRIKDDHKHAKYFAEEVSKISGFEINLKNIQSNIVMIKVRDGYADIVVEKLEKLGLQSLSLSKSIIRVVFHLHINDDDTEDAIKILKKINIKRGKDE
ncbi:MAG: GntG family PLP-dependent aldolase [Candidatus Marinimicrobia bacterium]|nr:GntG family PLP-dependent aldolase [Candidatus Neomarinimicrobiota bacterium]